MLVIVATTVVAVTSSSDPAPPGAGNAGGPAAPPAARPVDTRRLPSPDLAADGRGPALRTTGAGRLGAPATADLPRDAATAAPRPLTVVGATGSGRPGEPGTLAPFKTVHVPGGGDEVSDVIVDDNGDILVADGRRLHVFLPAGLYVGSAELDAPIRNLATGAGSLFVHAADAVLRLDGTGLETLATYRGVGRLDDQPVAGDWLVYVGDDGTFVRSSLRDSTTEQWEAPAGHTAIAILGRASTPGAVALTSPTGDPVHLTLTEYDLSGPSPLAVATTDLPTAGGPEPLLGLTADGAAAVVRVDRGTGTVRRLALGDARNGLTGADLDGSHGGSTGSTGSAAWAVPVAGGGAAAIVTGDAGTGPRSFTVLGAGAAAGVVTEAVAATQYAAWNRDGTQLVVLRGPSGSAGADLALHALPGAARPATRFSGAAGEYTPLAPVRALDTRIGLGTPGSGPLGPGTTVEVDLTSLPGIPPGGVAAVAVNLTAVGPSAPTYLTVYPAGTAPPAVSTLNVGAGETRPNLAVVRVGSGGRIAVFNAAGSAHAVIDVLGYFATVNGPAGGRYHPIEPRRLLDSRLQAPVGPGGLVGLPVRGRMGVPAGARAVALTLTAVGPSRDTYLTAWPSDAARPVASNLNPVAGDVVANLVFTGIGADGNIALFNAAGTTDVLVDVVGYWDEDRATEAGRYVPFSEPFRYYDSRRDDRPMAAGWLRSLRIAGWPDDGPIVPLPADGAQTAVYNLTATNTTAAGYLTAYPGPLGTLPPTASNLNFRAGQSVASLAVTGYGDDGEISFYNPSGNTDLIVDLAGFFTSSAF